MLRSLVLILLIVNAAFFAWSQGWLNKVVGVQPDSQHEPQRLNLQIQADKIVVLPAASAINNKAHRNKGTVASDAVSAAATSTAASSAANASTAASAASVTSPSASAPPTATPQAASTAHTTVAAANTAKELKCVEAGPFSAAEYTTLEASLRTTLPAGTWSSRTVAIQGLWLAYMGPYSDTDMLERKQAELRRIKGLNFEEVRTPANLALGISLGRYNRQEDAEAALNVLRNRGIRTAKIVNVRPSMEVQVLRVPHASVNMQVALAGMKLPQGKGFSPCRP